MLSEWIIFVGKPLEDHCEGLNHYVSGSSTRFILAA